MPETLIQSPRPGEIWRSRDKRDKGLLVTVLDIEQNYVVIKRFRESRVRHDRWHREYEGPVGEDST